MLPGRLLRRLREQGWPDNIARWAFSFATGREARAKLEATTLPAEPVSCGLPQGSPVSPILFMLFVAPLYHLAGATSRNRYGYADDMALRVAGVSAESNCRQLTGALKALLEWGTAEGVTIDPDKCELIHFHRSRASPTEGIRLPDQGFDIQPIPKGQSLRWLGVFFDSQLRFKDHARRLASKALTVAEAMKSLGNTVRGMAPHLIRQAVIACVYSVATFAAETWWQGPDKRGGQGLAQPLDKAFKTAARAIVPAYKTAPITALFREAGLNRASIHLEGIRRRAAVRLFRLDPEHPLAQRAFQPQPRPNRPTKLTTRLTRLAALAPPSTIKANPLAYAPWLLHKREALIERAHATFLPAGPTDLCLYSDGSLSLSLPTEGYRAGIGYTIYRQEKEIARGSLPHTPTASTIDIEVSAINEALRQASACKAPTDRRLIVVCDSLEAVINATSARPPALTVQKALETAKWWERLIGLPVQYHWAKAHSGLLGNEQADRLAKQGAQQPGRPIGGVTLAWAQQQAKDWPTQESARRWHLEAPTRYVELAIQPAPRKGPKELQIARSSLARLVAARTGHGDFAAYRQRFAFADGDNSRNRCSCGALKKPEHFFYCRIARRRYGGPTGPPRRLCPEYLLGDPEGASHFDAWIRKTKFYQEICPTWRREADNAVLEAADEAEDDGLQDAALEGSVALREGRGLDGPGRATAATGDAEGAPGGDAPQQ